MSDEPLDFIFWLDSKYRLADTAIGDLARDLMKVIRDNPLEEDFEDYDSLEDWLYHLDIHAAPQSVVNALKAAWEKYERER